MLARAISAVEEKMDRLHSTLCHSAPSINHHRVMLSDHQQLLPPHLTGYSTAIGSTAIGSPAIGTCECPELRSNYFSGVHFQRYLMDRVNALEMENAELRQAVVNLRKENSDIRTKLQQETVKKERHEYTCENIVDFTCIEVQSMLEDIGLGDYVSIFARELIDGSLLIQLDEEILKDELSMHSSSDRQKLLKLISGKETIKASNDRKLV